MAESVVEISQARSKNLINTWMVNPLIVDIFHALLDLGGSAHRDTVVERIAWRRSLTNTSPAFEREIVEAFDIHRACAVEEGLPALMYLPFGEDTKRWSLTRSVREFSDRYRTADGNLVETLTKLSQSSEAAKTRQVARSWGLKIGPKGVPE